MRGFKYCHDYHDGDPIYSKNRFEFGWDQELKMYAIWTDDATAFARAEMLIRQAHGTNPTYEELT